MRVSIVVERMRKTKVEVRMMEAEVRRVDVT